MRFYLGLALCGALTVPALAQDLPTGRAAQEIIFAEDGTVQGQIVAHPSLGEVDRAILRQLVPTQRYYAAVAYAPGEGLASQATLAAANYHDMENARRAALEGCNAARTGGPACVIVLEIQPNGWEPGRPLQLSTEATAALDTEYRRAGRPRYLSISSLTGQWGIGETPEDANGACDAEDCRPVVADP